MAIATAVTAVLAELEHLKREQVKEERLTEQERLDAEEKEEEAHCLLVLEQERLAAEEEEALDQSLDQRSLSWELFCTPLQ